MNNKVVYAYFNKEECFYIGIGKPRRPYHVSRHHRNHFTLSKIKKAQSSNCFHIQILHSGLSKEQACWYERMYIKSIGRRDLGLGTLTNLTDGGESTKGLKHTEKTKRLLSKQKQGSNHPFYGKPGHNKGRKLSDEQKQCISSKMKGENNPNYGKTFSMETRKKLSKNCPAKKKVNTPLGLFASYTDAAQSHNCSIPSISRRVNSKNFPKYYSM